MIGRHNLGGSILQGISGRGSQIRNALKKKHLLTLLVIELVV